MSRIGKLPITVPVGVNITIDGQHIVATGPKGKLSLDVLPACAVTLVDGILTVRLVDQEQKQMRGLTRTLLANMVEGVAHGFEKKLHVIGIGYNVKVQGQTIEFSLGLSHKVTHKLPAGVTATSEKDPKGNDILTLFGPDKQAVGQEAATIKMYRKPEPYKGKGIRYFGEAIKLKAGKTGAKTNT